MFWCTSNSRCSPAYFQSFFPFYSPMNIVIFFLVVFALMLYRMLNIFNKFSYASNSFYLPSPFRIVVVEHIFYMYYMFYILERSISTATNILLSGPTTEFIKSTISRISIVSHLSAYHSDTALRICSTEK